MYNFIKIFSLILVLYQFVYCGNSPPTQPPWLVNDDNNSNEKPIEVKSNAKNLLETARIRDEIKQAVAKGKYAVGPRDEARIVAIIDKILGEEFRSNQVMHGLVGDALGLADIGEDSGEDSDEEENDDDDDGNEKEHNKLENIVPDHVNIHLVDADNEASKIYIPEYQTSDGNETENTFREALQVNFIEEDVTFQIGKDIKMWKSLHSGQLVGLTDHRIVVVARMNGSYSIIVEANFTETLENIETVTVWNATTKSPVVLLLITFDESIRWLDADNLTVFWEWNVGRKIHSIQTIETHDERFLAILVDSYLMIYQVDIDRKAYWSTQAIPIASEAREMVFLNLGYHLILAVSQNNSVEIFQSDPASDDDDDDDNVHFMKTSSLATAGLVNMAAFQMGGFTYLAVGGDQSKIYRYHRGSFAEQIIFQANFGYVEWFLPVPCRTYRDDLILLVQHKINFDSHSLTVVEPLIWNGVSFETSKSIPCRIGEISDAFGGLNCILDSDRREGLRGSAVLANSKNASIIVPRFQAPAGLFRFETELVSKQTELELLEEMVQQMERMDREQGAVLNETLFRNWTIDFLETKDLYFDGDVMEFIINDTEQWNDNELKINLTDLLKEIESLGKLLIGIETNETIVYEAVVNELVVKNINGKPYEEILEGFAVENIGARSSQYRDSTGEEIVEILEITGNLELKSINGIVWDEFLSRILFNDEAIQVDYLNVSKVIIDGDISVGTINDLSFPDHFLLSNGPGFSKITGNKTFTETLNTNAMDCEGTINSVNPSKFITLSQDQVIPGTTTFSELEVTDSFEINGTISGKNLENFMMNPTLIDTRNINAEVQFRNLEVSGSIIVKGLLNNRSFDEILNDVVLKTDKEVTIKATKHFDEVNFSGGVQLLDRQINGIGLNEFVTKSTDQQLNVEQIKGNVFIENLALSGLYNSINVTKMDINSININQDQVVEAEITFQESELLTISNLEVIESLNGILVDDYSTLHKPLVLKEASMTADATIDELQLETDVEGDGRLNGFDMQKFNKDRFSMSENQTITSNLIADRIEIESNLYVNTINDNPTANLLQLMRKPKNISTLLQSDNIAINQLNITGNIQVKEINGIDTDRLWSDVIWLDRPNTVKGALHFLDAIHIQGDLHVDNQMINNRNFENFISDLIFKSDNISLDGTKRFTTPVNVMHSAEIDSFNEIPAERLAMKTRPLDVNGDLEIDGDISLKSLVIEGENLGNFSVRELLDVYTYDARQDVHFISGKVIFKGQTTVEMLHIDGNVNGLVGPRELFNDVAYKKHAATIKGLKIFKKPVVFEYGAKFERYNEINLQEFLSNIVYVNEIDPVRIEDPVVFHNPITVEHIHVEGNVTASDVMGCSLDEWIQNTYRTDESLDFKGPVHFHAGVLDGNRLLVVSLNDHNMADVITLNTPQNFKTNITFSTVFLQGSLAAANNVNGFNLKEEHANTLRLYGDQHITAPTVMQSLRIARHLETMKPINGRDLRQIATIHGDQVFRSSVSFKRIRTETLKTDDLVSGFNFSKWYDNIFRIDYGYEQIITGNWTIDEMIVEKSSLTIKPPLLTKERVDLFPMIRRLQEKYQELCNTVIELKDKATNRISFVKYLEKGGQLEQDAMITGIHPVIFPDSIILIVNKGCSSTLYRWDTRNGSFEHFETLETGTIDHIETTQAHSFVTYSQFHGYGCKLFGVNSWEIERNRTIFKGSTRDSLGGYRKIRSSDNEQAFKFLPLDINHTVHHFTGRLVQSIQDLHLMVSNSSDSPMVSATSPAVMPFGDIVGSVAKHLWTGVQQLGDLKTITEHARQIHKTLLRQSSSDTIPTIPKPDYFDGLFDDQPKKIIQNDSSNRLVGAHKSSDSDDIEIDPKNSNHGFDTVDSLLKMIPLGFNDFVASSVNSTNTGHVKSHIGNLVELILKTAQRKPQTTGNVRRKAESINNKTETEALTTLRKYAEDYSIDGFYESVTKPPRPPMEHFAPTGIIITPNDVFHQDQAIALRVGSKRNRRNILAVTSSTDYSSIRLYVDGMEGPVFQHIKAINPRSLVAIHIQDETLLAFIENSYTIRVMKYRGIEGFAEWSRQHSDEAITQLSTVSLAIDKSVCRKAFLIAAVARNVEFYEVKMGGMCPVNNLINDCNGWW